MPPLSAKEGTLYPITLSIRDHLLGALSPKYFCLEPSLIKSSLCNVDSQTKRRRTVEMCRIGCNESFGADSLLLDQPMNYTVVASEPVQLAIIHRTSLQGVLVKLCFHVHHHHHHHHFFNRTVDKTQPRQSINSYSKCLFINVVCLGRCCSQF